MLRITWLIFNHPYHDICLPVDVVYNKLQFSSKPCIHASNQHYVESVEASTG
ncbi:hypothetical protein D5086_005541, partial [Populus alba]